MLQTFICLYKFLSAFLELGYTNKHVMDTYAAVILIDAKRKSIRFANQIIY